MKKIDPLTHIAVENGSIFLNFLVNIRNYMHLHAGTIIIVPNRDTNRRRCTMLNHVEMDD